MKSNRSVKAKALIQIYSAVGLFDKLKQPKESRLPDTPTKRYEFTETGEKVLVDDNYRPKKSFFSAERKQQFVSGAKRTGKALHSGAKKFGEMQRQADMRELKRGKSGKVANDYGFDYDDMFSTPRDSRRRNARQSGPTASDIIDSILGTGGKNRPRNKKSRDIFDFSDL